MTTSEELLRRLKTVSMPREAAIRRIYVSKKQVFLLVNEYLTLKEYWRLRQVCKRWKSTIECFTDVLKQKIKDEFEVTLWENAKGQERAHVTLKGGGQIHPMFKVNRTYFTTVAMNPMKLIVHLSKVSASSFKEKKPKKKKINPPVKTGEYVFPREILLGFLSKLDVPELWRLRLVCKEWKFLIEDEAFIRPLFLKQYQFRPTATSETGEGPKTFYVYERKYRYKYLGGWKCEYMFTPKQLKKSVKHIISLANTNYRRRKFLELGYNIKLNSTALRKLFSGDCDIKHLEFLNRLITSPEYLQEIYEKCQEPKTQSEDEV